MSIDVTEIIIAVIGIVFTGVVIPLIKALFDWIKSKTASEALKAALDEAQSVADIVVLSLQQTVVDDLKAKSADGKLTAEDAKTVAQKALTQFMHNVSSKTLEVLQNNADNLGDYIRDLLEARLKVLKG